MFDRASGVTMMEAYGAADLKAIEAAAREGGANLVSMRLLKKVPRSGGIIDEMNAALPNPEDRLMVTRAYNYGWTPDKALEEGASTRIVDFLRKQHALDTRKANESAASRKAMNKPNTFEPKPFHYMMTKTWVGTHRAPIFQAGTHTNPVGYGSGHGAKAAMDDANRVIKEMNKEHPGLLREYADNPVGDQISAKDYIRPAGRQLDLEIAAQVQEGNPIAHRVMQMRGRIFDKDPRRFAKQTGKFGYRGFREIEPLTKKEIEEIIVGNLVESNRLLARDAVQATMGTQLGKLAQEWPKLAEQIVARIDSHQGIKGPISRGIDAAVDQVLAPALGANSASRLARAANRALFTLTLGAGDMGFVALNAATPIQTVLPEVAFVLGTPLPRLSEYYAHMMVAGRKGGIQSVSFVEPWRLLRKGMKDLTRADAEMVADFEWAIKNHVISRPFIESFVGRTTEDIVNLNSVLQGKEGFGNWMLKLSEFGPAKSEEFSRGLAFATGRRVGRDFFNMSRAEANEFGRQFTYRSMYGYGVGDRGRVITGAVGTGFGLFKNWVMHYMANFGLYANEAVFRGNYKPLLWSMLGTGALGGVAALPGYGIATSISKILTDQSLVDNVYDLMGVGDVTLAADTFSYGLPAALDVSIQARAVAPGSHFVRDVGLLTGVASMDRLAAIYDFAADAVDSWKTTGRNPMSSQNVRNQFVRAIAPRSLQRWYSITGEGVLKSLKTGNRIEDGMSRFQRGLSFLGLTPLDAEKAFTIANDLYSDQAKLRAGIASHSLALAEAWAAGDADYAASIMRMAFYEGLPLDRIQQGAKSRMAKGHEDALERKHGVYASAQKRKLYGLD
jgi:hypothetical protein